MCRYQVKIIHLKPTQHVKQDNCSLLDSRSSLRVEFLKLQSNYKSTHFLSQAKLVYNIPMNPLNYIKVLEHHAYFIHAFKDSVNHLKEYLKKTFNIDHSQNPDFFHERFETLGIDDSRKIKENHLSKSFTQDGKRIFIIEASGITHEAQNSLLKIFEEPNENSHFFIVMPSVNLLLPTLRSRLYIVKQNQEDREDTEIVKQVESFLKLSKKDKIDFMDNIAKEISDEDKSKSDAQEFLVTLETVIYKKFGTKNPRALKAILKAREYMNDRSPSIKQLLEYIALSI